MGGLSVADLEKALGCQLPPDVARTLQMDGGLKGPTDCDLLYSPEGILQRTHLLRAENWFPKSLARIVVLGDDGCGNLVAYDPTNSEAILWNPADGDWIQERRQSVSELWNHIVAVYSQSEADLDHER